MAIEDRPLNELELDCIVLSQERLRKDPLYLGLLKDKSELEASINNDNYGVTKAFVRRLFNELKMIEYQIGWWDGKTFSDVIKERS